MNEMAADYASVQFLSICCDKLDGAREIIEKEDDLRWPHLDHYFMAQKDKERAKKILGFTSVPFYVMLNDKGEITQLGNKIDWSSIPGLIKEGDVNKENDAVGEEFTDVKKEEEKADEDRVFVLGDLDF